MIDNAQELDLVMLMHNLLEYIQRYSVTSGCLWNYCRGKTPARSENPGDANRPAVPTLNIEVTIPLKYLSKFWRFLNY